MNDDMEELGDPHCAQCLVSLHVVGTVERILAKATTATIRRKLIAIPARIASSGRRIRVHLPHAWPWEAAWTVLFAHATGPPQR